tara:strand:+ start:31864 stop:34137 length:2274 start_codon:yes stop_codon:yes gene_type:complete
MTSKELMSDYNFISKYSQKKPDGTKESWEESLDRIYSMHRVKYKDVLSGPDGHKLEEALNFCQKMEMDKAVLSAQRVRQFADPREHRGILRHNGKLYNCASAYMDNIERFHQTIFALLEGSGVGLSLQKEHISKLPVFHKNSGDELNSTIYKIEDSIEGWAESVRYLIRSYVTHTHKKQEFDYSDIRPKGSIIADQFLAPGPDGLRQSLEKIRDILDNATKDRPRKLLSVEIYDIIMWEADAVLSGGVRRSATIMLFSHDDEHMLSAKIGDWYIKNPQRRLSNNTVMLHRDTVTREQFDNVMKYVKEFGEPGFGFTNSIHTTFNPCYEIGKTPIIMETGETGFQYCNLTEINGSYCSSKQRLMDSVKAATILGTLQAGYDQFNYLGDITGKIVKKEALLGVSITGWMTNTDILFNEEIITEASKFSLEVNEEISKLIGINLAARITTTKPSGNASVLLGTSSGIHGDHSERYIRNIQVNKDEISGNVFKSVNPLSVENSMWSDTDNVISFPLEATDKTILKSDLLGVKQLEYVKKAQEWWVLNGHRPELSTVKGTTHNVSNTIQVPGDEWDDVADFIWENRNIFSGVSLLPTSGDLDYPQAPFQRVKTTIQLATEYGDAVLYASGLIVDQIGVFKHLWNACDTLKHSIDIKIIEDRFVEVDGEMAVIHGDNKEERIKKINQQDWVRRLSKFSMNHFNGNLDKAINCLKDVELNYRWNKLNKTLREVKWDKVDFSKEFQESSDQVATACAGGKCEINF